MTMKKYLVIGGNVVSKHDGETHFISARRLCDLYRVDPQECICVSDRREIRYMIQAKIKDLIELLPDPSGKYELPEN